MIVTIGLTGLIWLIFGVFVYFCVKRRIRASKVREGDVFVDEVDNPDPFQKECSLNGRIIKEIKRSINDGNLYAKYVFADIDVLPNGQFKVLREYGITYSARTDIFVGYGLHRHVGNIKDQE